MIDIDDPFKAVRANRNNKNSYSHLLQIAKDQQASNSQVMMVTQASQDNINYTIMPESVNESMSKIMLNTMTDPDEKFKTGAYTFESVNIKKPLQLKFRATSAHLHSNTIQQPPRLAAFVNNRNQASFANTRFSAYDGATIKQIPVASTLKRNFK